MQTWYLSDDTPMEDLDTDATSFQRYDDRGHYRLMLVCKQWQAVVLGISAFWTSGPLSWLCGQSSLVLTYGNESAANVSRLSSAHAGKGSLWVENDVNTV